MFPTDPIRPVSGAGSDPLSISRTELIKRVNRYQKNGGDEAADDERKREEKRHDAFAEQRSNIWITSNPDAEQAGVYDEQGRVDTRDVQGSRSNLRHLDTSI